MVTMLVEKFMTFPEHHFGGLVNPLQGVKTGF